MKKMKIAVVVEALSYRSGSRAPLELAKHLKRRGHEIVVYSYNFRKDKMVIHDFKKLNIPIITFTKNTFPLLGKYFSIFSFLNAFSNDSTEIICFAGTIPFFIASKLSKIPIILMYHGTQPNAYLERLLPNQTLTLWHMFLNRLGNIYIYFVNLILVRLSSAIVAISKFASDEVSQLYKRKPDAIIYLGTTVFRNTDTSSKEDKKYLNLLTVSRITPYKGFHILIDCLNNLDNKKIFLTIVGSIYKKNYLEYLKKISNNNVRIFINPTDQKLEKFYKESDIYISADRYLYFGLPIFEAALFAKPSISLNFAAAAEIIDHGKTGFVAKTKEELSNYIQQFVEKSSLIKKMGKEAKKKAQFYSWEKCAREWENIIIKIINENTKKYA